MRKILALFSLMSFLIFGPWAYAQTQAPAAQTEAEFRLLKEQYQLLQGKEEKLVLEYGKIIETLRQERKEHQDFVEKIYMWATGLLVFVIGLSSILSYQQLKRYINGKVVEKCTNLISEVVSGKRDIIERQLKKYDQQAKIRQKSRIIILSKSLLEGNEINDYLTKVGFTVAKDEIANFFNHDEATKRSLSDWDAVIINNLSNDENDKIIQTKIVNSLKDKAILFYKGGQINEENKAFNVSAVNMPSQLYGNLMNLLEYREVVN